MVSQKLLLAGWALCLVACSNEPLPPRPIVNTGSYDWADQVKDAQGFPLPGWGISISPSSGRGM